jgi:hypothetical protein
MAQLAGRARLVAAALDRCRGVVEAAADVRREGSALGR